MTEINLSPEVAIPSIQVGFFTRNEKRDITDLIYRCRNPFYSGRFFHSKTIGMANMYFSRNPFYSGRFFHSPYSSWRYIYPAFGRNPFYSGRFFHSPTTRSPCPSSGRSQSLLFRSVFSLGWSSPPWARPEMCVAIPSIQVGFFTPRCQRRGITSSLRSQSLLFRSVFSLKVTEINLSPDRDFVAIPSIQVGFFTP